MPANRPASLAAAPSSPLEPPPRGDVDAQLRFLLRYGLLAPSGTPQPWAIHLRDAVLELRLVHVCDEAPLASVHREGVVGAGAALALLRLAVRQLGFAESVVLFPDDGDERLLARVYLDAKTGTPAEAYVLYQALLAPSFRSDEGLVSTLDPSLVTELAALCAEERVTLVAAPADSAEGELAVDTACGMPSLGPAAGALFGCAPREAWPVGGALREDAPAPLLGAESHLIATDGDSAGAWLAAGQALTRVLLRARVDGVTTVISSVSASRRAARARCERLGAVVPQVAVRLGYPTRAPAAADDGPLPRLAAG